MSGSDASPGHDALMVLHAEVDIGVGRVAARHAERLQCGRGCSRCCTDGITVFEIEAERIRRNHAALLDEGIPHPPGACAFLDADGACRIYDDRPYVCRSEGVPLRWLESDEERTVELRDICPLNDLEAAPVETLHPDTCWTLGPYEQRLADLQQSTHGTMRRVPLRDLFAFESTRR